MSWTQGIVIAAVVAVSALFLWFVQKKYMK